MSCDGEEDGMSCDGEEDGMSCDGEEDGMANVGNEYYCLARVETCDAVRGGDWFTCGVFGWWM